MKWRSHSDCGVAKERTPMPLPTPAESEGKNGIVLCRVRGSGFLWPSFAQTYLQDLTFPSIFLLFAYIFLTSKLFDPIANPKHPRLIYGIELRANLR